MVPLWFQIASQFQPRGNYMASFKTKPNGKILVRIRKRGVKKFREFDDMKIAETWASKIETMIDLDLHEEVAEDAKENDILFREMIDKYVKNRLVSLKSYTKDKSRYERLKEIKLAQKRFTDVNEKDIEAFMTARRTQVYESSVAREFACLSSVYTYGLKNEGFNLTIKNNPFFNVEKPSTKPKKKTSYADDETLKIVLDEIQRVHHPKDTRVCDIINVAMELGCRRGELAKLRREHISFEKKSITLYDTKNSEDRTIPMLPEVEKILEKYKDKKGLLFDLEADSITQNVTRAKKRLENRGIELDFSFRSTRKTAITDLLIADDLDIASVAVISGHKTVQVIRKHYLDEAIHSKLYEKIVKGRAKRADEEAEQASKEEKAKAR